jgi:hypothetical protein
MAQMVEYQPSKHMVLSSTPSTMKKKKCPEEDPEQDKDPSQSHSYDKAMI